MSSIKKKIYVVRDFYGNNNQLLELLPNDKRRHQVGKFLCKCGNIFICRIGGIIAETTKGCGCLRNHEKTHGLSEHRLYNTWTLIKARCYCTTNKLYKYYGKRGITLSEEFQDAKIFIEYIMSLPRYKDRLTLDLSIDRIDNDKHYERGNLRWATRKEQINNRRNPNVTKMLILNNI